jgi:hypothetical protein
MTDMGRQSLGDGSRQQDKSGQKLGLWRMSAFEKSKAETEYPQMSVRGAQALGIRMPHAQGPRQTAYLVV